MNDHDNIDKILIKPNKTNISDILNDKCLFCFDQLSNIENIINPKYCNCKVYLHLECLSLIEKTGMLCPICRININTLPVVNQQLLNSNYTYSEPKIFTLPFKLFEKYPNILTWLILILCMFIITFSYVIPKIMWHFIKIFYNNNHIIIKKYLQSFAIVYIGTTCIIYYFKK